MELDEWSNVHNKHIINVSIGDSEGNPVLDSTFDMSGKQHRTEYLQLITEKKIKNLESLSSSWFICCR